MFVSLPTTTSSDAIIDCIIDQLAHLALALWPVWFSDVQLATCDARDGLTRQSAMLRARSAATTVSGGIAAWAEQAAALAVEGRPPRVAGAARALEIRQLCLAIHRHGAVILVEAPDPTPDALVLALEWTARCANAPVAVLFGKLPERAPHSTAFFMGRLALSIANPLRPSAFCPLSLKLQRPGSRPLRADRIP